MTTKLSRLRSELRSEIEAITVEWVRRVRSDPYLKSDNPLTLTQIIDHVPQMLEEMCDLLERAEDPDIEQIRASSQHGYIRSAEGYSLTDLLRELEILRDCVFDFVAEAEARIGLTRAELRLVNKYFAEDILFVAEHFLSRRAGES
jgi:hypothetical protein